MVYHCPSKAQQPGAGLFYMNEDDFITDMSKKLFTFHL